jgi:hypothetical protein
VCAQSALCLFTEVGKSQLFFQSKFSWRNVSYINSLGEAGYLTHKYLEKSILSWDYLSKRNAFCFITFFLQCAVWKKQCRKDVWLLYVWRAHTKNFQSNLENIFAVRSGYLHLTSLVLGRIQVFYMTFRKSVGGRPYKENCFLAIKLLKL